MANGQGCDSKTGNNLNGTLIDELGWLNNVKTFHVYGNPKLTGSLPVGMSSMGAMGNMSLQHNGLSGSIPEKWSDMQWLHEIELFNMGLTGAWPSEWDDLHQLWVLKVHGNQLTGNPFSEDHVMDNLFLVQVHANKFSGEMPNWLGKKAANGELYMLHWYSNDGLCAPDNTD